MGSEQAGNSGFYSNFERMFGFLSVNSQYLSFVLEKSCFCRCCRPTLKELTSLCVCVKLYAHVCIYLCERYCGLKPAVVLTFFSALHNIGTKILEDNDK